MSLSKYVADAVAEIDRSGLDYRVTDMGTEIEGAPSSDRAGDSSVLAAVGGKGEGDWNEVMSLLKKVWSRVLGESDRLLMYISLDERTDKSAHIETKVRAVEDVLRKST